MWGPVSWRPRKTQCFSSRPKVEKYYTQTAQDQKDGSRDEDRLYTREFGPLTLKRKPDMGLCNWIPSARDGDGPVLGTHWSASLAKRLHSRLGGRPCLKKESWKMIEEETWSWFLALTPAHPQEWAHMRMHAYKHCPTQLKDYKPSGRRVYPTHLDCQPVFLSWPSGDWMITVLSRAGTLVYSFSLWVTYKC